LSELARTPELRMRVIGAPLDDRELGWPHITDVADPAPYLTGGELVLTAGVWHTGPESSRRFVAALLARGACGIVFGITPPDSPETPEDLIEVCASSELALLEVPPEVPFVAVCKAIAADAAERHEAPLHAAIRRNEQLLRAASSGGRAALVEVLAREPGLEPFLVDRHGTVLVAGPRRPTSAESRAAGALARAETPGVAESEPEPGRRQVSFAIRGMRRTATSPRTSSSGTCTRTRSGRGSGPGCWARWSTTTPVAEGVWSRRSRPFCAQAVSGRRRRER